MKKSFILLLTALLSTATLLAQYSPCYEAAFAEGKRLYNAGQYAQANKYFNEAKGCPDPNTAAANEWIGKCNKKLEEQEAFEAYEKGLRYYENGELKKALESFMSGASKGNADAQYMLGRMYYSGKGVDRDCKEAVKWYQKAIDQNHADAMAWMSDVYVEKKCGDEVDYDKALSLIRRSIELGSAYGMNNLGYMYLKGYGVAQDYQEAVKWYRKSAEQGNSSGQCNLGYMYLNGYGVTQDYQEAVKWFRKSAEQGDSSGQYDLGYMYQYGEGVEQDYQEAVKWYRKSAEQGDASAQSNLGYMYRHGYGVAQDYQEAVKWYRKSAEQGNDASIYALRRLGY